MQNINVVLFDYFTILDAFGPVEVFRCMEKLYTINFYSKLGGKIKTKPELGIETKTFKEIESHDVLLIPGGAGTRNLVNDNEFIRDSKELVEKSKIVLSVCTRSAMLAKTGMLRNHKATSNKMAFDWVVRAK
jgi:putative intracellular protease/amidase